MRSLYQRYAAIAALLLSLFVTVTAFAQPQTTKSSEGTDFWLTFPPNYGFTSDEPTVVDQLSFVIAARAAASVRVTATPPNNSGLTLFDVTYTLGAGEQRIVRLPKEYALANNNTPDDRWTLDVDSIRIRSTAPIAVYGRNLVGFTTDGYLALPTATLGTDYVVGTYRPAFFSSQIKLVATQNATTVTLRLTATTQDTAGVEVPAQVARTVTLQQGETLYIPANNGTADTPPSGDLTGSYIVADKPIAVLGGNKCTQVPYGVVACDHLVEMFAPISALGSTFLMVPTKRDLDGDRVRVIASADDTVIYRGGFASRSLMRGEFEEFQIDSPERVDTSRPALVMQYMRGASASGGNGDPASMLVVPTPQFQNSYQVATFQSPPMPPETTDLIRLKDNYLNVVIPTGAISTLKLDGVAVPPNLFAPIPRSGYSAARLPVALGAHRIEAVVGFGLYAYGVGSYESYAYPGGMAVDSINDPSDPFPPNARVVQVGGVLQGLATDSSDVNANGILDPEELVWGTAIVPRSEDTNRNSTLDVGEDFNGNGRIDRDLGIAKIELSPSSVNLSLTVTPFDIGSLAVAFTVSRIDPTKDGIGNVVITDVSGNRKEQGVSLSNGTKIRNVRVLETVANNNIELDLNSFATQPTAIRSFADRYEVEWNYAEASSTTALDLSYDVSFKTPIPNEDRVVSRQTLLEYDDAAGNRIRYEIGAKGVKVLDTQFDIAAALDKNDYVIGERGLLTVTASNLGVIAASPEYACVRLLDRVGAVVQTLRGSFLQDAIYFYANTIPAGQNGNYSPNPLEIRLDGLLVGAYTAEVFMLRPDAQSCAPNESLRKVALPFTISSVPGSVAVNSGLQLDRATYRPSDRVLAATVVRNLLPNSIANGYSMRVQIMRPDGSMLTPITKSVPQLVPLNQWSSDFVFALRNEAPGIYTTISQLLDDTNSVVETRNSRFNVLSSTVTGYGLKGVITVAPTSVRSGEATAFSATVTNQGNAAFNALPLAISVIDPDSGTVVKQFDQTSAVAINANLPFDATWIVQATPKTYIVVLTATIVSGAETVRLTLAQDALQVLPPLPATISATSGTPQVTQVGTAYPQSLEATVVDSATNAPRSGVSVAFTALSSGASVSFPNGNTASTDANGKARISVAANNTPGALVVIATAANVSGEARFELTNTVANQLPTINWVSPAANTVANSPGTFALTASASDADGTVAEVEFFSGTTLLGTGTLTNGNYVYSWTNVAAGTYSVTAKATDDKGATVTTTAVSLIVNGLPTVTLTSPANNANFTAPATIAITATAADGDGTISKVEFFNGTTLLGVGTLTNGNYVFNWASVPVGNYTITVKATDDRGASTTTAPITLAVNAPANQAPTINWVAPASNTVVNAPGNFALSASASDADGTISKVEFFNGATPLGTGTLSGGTYVYSWTNVAAGTYSVTAKATDDKGATATTSAVTLVVNALPTVAITAPANNATFTAPATIAITATAADSDGTISKVEFFNGTTLLGAGTLSGGNYVYSWANVAAGTYTITAKATDNRNATVTSNAVTVKVNPPANKPPIVSITAPADNTLVNAPSTFALTATASDSDGTVAKVEFFEGTNLLGEAALTNGSYVYSWTNVPAGNYVVTAVATDDKGATGTSDPVNLKVNALPTVTITAPANNSTYVALANIALSVTATDVDGSITKVELLSGTTVLGEATLSNGAYAVSWTNVPVGNYSITARATDDRGGIAVSAPIAITVNAPANQAPTINWISPSTNAVVNAPGTFALTASASDADGTVSTVEFFSGAALLGTGTLTNGNYVYSWTNVAAGTYSVTAKATDDKGATATTTAVSLIVNALPTVTITSPANNASFTAPATIAITATAADSDGTISKVEFFNGTTLLGAGTLTNGNYVFSWTNVPVGNYTITAKATDNRGATAISGGVAMSVQSCGTVSAFTLNAQDGVPTATLITSNAITVGGINCPAPISVTNGEYSINGGTFTNVAGTVAKGDTVRVRVLSSTTSGQSTSVIVNIGGVITNFTVITGSTPTLTQSLLREGRVLVLISCSESEDQGAGLCGPSRKQFVDQYLTSLGVDFFSTTDVAEFQRELRCGRYNVYWVSGGFAKLKGSLDDELVEAIHRGDGLVLDGVHDERNSRLDDAAQLSYRGKLPGDGHTVFNNTAILPSGNFTTSGKAAKLSLDGAAKQASFDSLNSGNAAIATSTYGLGKTITYGFDWVATARAQPNSTLIKDTMARGLSHVVPTASGDPTPGAYVRVRASIASPSASASSFEVKTTLPTTASFVAATPAPTSVSGGVVTWRIDVAANATVNIDWSVRAPTVDSTASIVTTLARVSGTTVTPLTSASTSFAVNGYATRATNTRAQVAALAPSKQPEKLARDRALVDLDTATTKRAAGAYQSAIDALLDALSELDRITSVPTQASQLSVDELLKIVSREACAAGVTPTACSATGSFTNPVEFGNDGNDSGNVKLVRVRGGGAGSSTSGFGGGTWQVGALVKTSNTQTQSLTNFQLASARSYDPRGTEKSFSNSLSQANRRSPRVPRTNGRLAMP
jgi:hypothetical protein